METRNENRFRFSMDVKLGTITGVAYHMVTAVLIVSLMTLGFMILLTLASQNWAVIPAFFLYAVSLPTLARFVGARKKKELMRTLGNAPVE
ncbi:MAG: hypothetical protein SV377_05445 [Halobacteria archaeon]|nr:hypothetical protein [Halobacteria archaeon]